MESSTNLIPLVINGALGLGIFMAIWYSLMYIVAAFRAHIGWGIAVLIIPFAGLIFLFARWDYAKQPFLLQLLGGFICGAAVFAGVAMEAEFWDFYHRLFDWYVVDPQV